MRGKPGRILILKDGRKAIQYSSQPLWADFKRIVLHLVDDEFKLMKENGKDKTLLVTSDKLLEIADKVIGMVD